MITRLQSFARTASVVMNEFGDKVEKEVHDRQRGICPQRKRAAISTSCSRRSWNSLRLSADTVTPRIKNDAVCFEDNGLTDERLRDM